MFSCCSSRFRPRTTTDEAVGADDGCDCGCGMGADGMAEVVIDDEEEPAALDRLVAEILLNTFYHNRT